MLIPEEIRIGAIVWKIELVDPYTLDCEAGVQGDTTPNKQRIRINRDLSIEMQQQTLIHELLHAVNLEMPHEEVEMLATLLHQIILQIH